MSFYVERNDSLRIWEHVLSAKYFSRQIELQHGLVCRNSRFTLLVCRSRRGFFFRQPRRRILRAESPAKNIVGSEGVVAGRKV